MGREESKEQAKAAAREKEQAAFEKKQERKDKVWEQGARDTSKQDADAAKTAAATARKAEARAQEEAEGGSSSTSQGPALKKCKDCGKKFNPKKGCDNCIAILLGSAPGKKGKKK